MTGRVSEPRFAEVAARYGTPVFVYDAATIKQRVAELRAHLGYRPVRIYYSAKANPAIGLIVLTRQLGLGFDACSPGDLRLAQLAGVPGTAISYTGFGSTDAELLAAAHQASDLVLDSAEEVDRLAALGAQRPIGLRVNPGIESGSHQHVAAGAPHAKFGVPMIDVVEVAHHAESAGLPVVGLHAHLGSDVMDAEPHTELLAMMAELAKPLVNLRWCNLGGGWGTPRWPGDPPFPWEQVGDAAVRHLSARRLELRVEPGGYLTIDAGTLLGEVVATKGATSASPELLITNANTNHLPSVLLYGSHHNVSVVGRGEGDVHRRYRIAGNLMQAGDILAQDRELPEAKIGDVLAFSHAGAYSSCRSPVFNERPRPPEVLVDGGDVTLIRRAESIEDLFSRDADPRARTSDRSIDSAACRPT